MAVVSRRGINLALKDFVSDQVWFVRHCGQNPAVIADAADRHCERSETTQLLGLEFNRLQFCSCTLPPNPLDEAVDGLGYFATLAMTVGFLVWGLYSPARIPFL